MPSRISLMVIAGFQPSSSFRIDRHTVPDGYTFGWKSGGVNRHFGGFVGYSGVRGQYIALCGAAEADAVRDEGMRS